MRGDRPMPRGERRESQAKQPILPEHCEPEAGAGTHARSNLKTGRRLKAAPTPMKWCRQNRLRLKGGEIARVRRRSSYPAVRLALHFGRTRGRAHPLRTPTGRSRPWRTRLPAALFRGCSCGSRMPRASPGGGRRPEDAPELLRPPPPPISTTTVLSAGSPQELPAESSPPRATGGARPPPLYRCRRSRVLATEVLGCTNEGGWPFEPRPRPGRRETDGAPPNEHETSTRDRRRSDEQDCLLPGWPRSPGGHLHDVIFRSDDPGSRLLHGRRWETFPGAIRRAIRRALARAVLTARALLARSAR
jgi:hypothetical protein